jgi:hypothetical protein
MQPWIPADLGPPPRTNPTRPGLPLAALFGKSIAAAQPEAHAVADPGLFVHADRGVRVGDQASFGGPPRVNLAFAVDGLDEAGGFEFGQGVADGVTGDAVLLAQRPSRRLASWCTPGCSSPKTPSCCVCSPTGQPPASRASTASGRRLLCWPDRPVRHASPCGSGHVAGTEGHLLQAAAHRAAARSPGLQLPRQARPR